ncbi:MAG: hypothetical protein AAF378_02245 [Cyanobacteria bacterium P01_A01_bin.84]
MSILDKLGSNLGESTNFLQKTLDKYIVFNPEAKQVILKNQAVLLLSQQAQSRVEQLKNLETHPEEGLIATVEHNQVTAQLHFTPVKMTLHQDSIDGELRLLETPEFETDSMIYKYLIAGWKTFLGGKIPSGVLPKEFRIESDDRVYYTLPRNQLKLLDAFAHTLENGSTLIANLKQGELIIETSVALSLDDLKLHSLLQLLNTYRSKVRS